MINFRLQPMVGNESGEQRVIAKTTE